MSPIDINGYLAGLDRAIGMCDDHTRIVPGHGAVTAKPVLAAYRVHVKQLRAQVLELVNQGRSPEEIKLHNPVNAWYRGGLFEPDAFVDMVMASERK
jgi:cyclase